jgi:hypothetical protein
MVERRRLGVAFAGNMLERSEKSQRGPELVGWNLTVPFAEGLKAFIELGCCGANFAESDRAGGTPHLMGETLGLDDCSPSKFAAPIALSQQLRQGRHLIEQLGVVPLDQRAKLLL